MRLHPSGDFFWAAASMAAAHWDVPRHAPPRARARGLARAARAVPVVGAGAAHDLGRKSRAPGSSKWHPKMGDHENKTIIHPNFTHLLMKKSVFT